MFVSSITGDVFFFLLLLDHSIAVDDGCRFSDCMVELLVMNEGRVMKDTDAVARMTESVTKFNVILGRID
jgi:hypothetical protein